MNIGERLKEEREKIGYSQERLGAIGGVQKRAQINYESGERQPDAAYLRGVAQVGVDVQYVLLGVRSANLLDVFLDDDFVSETNAEHTRSVIAGQVDRGGSPALSADEKALLDSYRRCTPEARVNLIQTAALLSAGFPAGTGKRAGMSKGGNGQKVVGDNAIQIGSVTGKARIKNR